MTPAEKVAAKVTARIMRAARKQLGLTQTEVAPKLGVSQSALCKLEKAQLIPSVHQWFEFCKLTGISPESHLNGYIDRKRPVVLKSERKEGSFILPSKYAENRGMSSRAIRPILNYFAASLGEKRLQEFLHSCSVDSDFFVNLDSAINFQFSLDLARHLREAGVINSGNLGPLWKSAARPESHGLLHSSYDEAPSTVDMLKRLADNAPYYSVDFSYCLEEQSEGQLVLSVKPAAHLDSTSFRRDPDLGDYVCRCHKNYLECFTGYRDNVEASVKERQCVHKGADRCVYEIELPRQVAS